MGDKSMIEWTEATWNPIRGCSRVSDGCVNCYAETVANRFKGEGLPYEGLIAKGGQWNGKIKVVKHMMDQPVRWQKPRRIFVNSMSDLFHENVPEEVIWRIFGVMALCQRHTFQVLTKRPERMLEFMKQLVECPDVLGEYAAEFALWEDIPELEEWPPKNIWLGVSAEDQKTADERIPLLLKTPAAVRWLSAEPLLGELDLIGPGYFTDSVHMQAGGLVGLDWVVVGGESAAGTIGYKNPARPMHPDWARQLRDQCKEGGVPFFFKQWGNYSPVMLGPGQIFGAGCFVLPNGKLGSQEQYWNGEAAEMNHVGKAKAGRLLDGEIHSEYPQ